MTSLSSNNDITGVILQYSSMPDKHAHTGDCTTSPPRKTLTVGSLFSGIGGIDLGLERAGFDIQWQVEIDPYVQKVLAKHWPDVARYGDIRTVGKHNLAPVDLICGGFPCQDISIANQRNPQGIQGAKSGLWTEYHRIICELRPRFVLVENVPALLDRGLGRVLGNLAEIGYDAEWQCLQASDFGAYHRRERLFIVAYPIRKFFHASRVQSDRRAIIARSARWIPEPRMDRVVNGLPSRLDKIRNKGLGNAVVPQVAEYIGRCILAAVEADREVAS